MNRYCSNGKRLQTIELDSDQDDSAIILKSGNSYKNYMNCAVYVEAEKGYGIIVTVSKINLRNIVDNLEIEINKSLKPEWTGDKFNDIESVVYVADRKVKVEFLTGYSSESTKYREFELILTAYRKSYKCKESELYCDKSRCISKHYQCDGHNNCGNNLDEIGCVKAKQASNFAIVGGLVGALMVLLLLCYCWKCCCAISKKRKEYVEFSKDNTDSSNTEPQVSNIEPSAPRSPNNMNYGSTTSYQVRYPINPNYPYFIDGANAPPYPVHLTGPQPSSVLNQYSHFPPPPPYSPHDNLGNDDNNHSHLNSEQTSKP